MRTLAHSDFNESAFEPDTFPELCANLHEALMALEADTDAFMQLQAASREEQSAVASRLRTECDLLQQTVPTSDEACKVLEKQRHVLEARVREMQAVMQAQGLQMETIMQKFPIPPNEAERLLVEERLQLTGRWHIHELDSILCEMGQKLGAEFALGMVNSINHAEMVMNSVVYKARFIASAASDPERIITADVASWGEAKLAFPRKISVCQYVVAEQEVQCLRSGIDPVMTELASSVPQLPELVAALMGVDEGYDCTSPHLLLDMYCRFSSSSMEIVSNPDLLPESGAEALRAVFSISFHEQGTYYGVPLFVEGQVVATCCACFVGLGTADRELEMEQKLVDRFS